MVFKHYFTLSEIRKVGYCTKTTNNKLYTATVLLPKTKIPLKLENTKLIERDKTIYNIAEFEGFYDWQRSHLSEPEFVLHDGPPYANGKLHMGHAINKIMKDTILRYYVLKGNKVHYIPGWDCHGLPIEMKAISSSTNLNDVDLRKKARNFVTKTIQDQKEGFQAWGVLGDWKNTYQTSNVDYVKMQLRLFFKLYKRKLIYRDFKPVFWSPSSRTALAEAELEYNEAHKTPSLYLQLEIRDIPKLPSIKGKRVYGIIWTTTPWTLPANCAVCYNETIEYSLIRKNYSDAENMYIVASALLSSVSEILNCNFEVIERFKGSVLQGSTYTHPIYRDKIHRFYNGAHVTATKGTGLVHTAPAHGPDDFLVSLMNKIPTTDLVDALGCFKEEAGKNLYGKMVLSEGNKEVINMLKENILRVDEITHSYPYDWRTKKPVIIRASQQWFINTEVLKKEAIDCLSSIEIFPKDRSDIFRKNLINELQKRPYWCISRQRKWGVPIPVFYDKQTQEVILNENILHHYCNLLETNGTDFWWKLSNKELLPDSLSELEEQNLEKGQDIMDIWLDSGLSWATVLDGMKVADLYLEGSDQFKGWFQSSLLTSVALRNKAPFKSIYIHGFAVDEKGNKMSKSLGNVIDPVDIINGKKGHKPYGIDVLRWWVACHASHVALANVSTNVLQSCVEEVQKIRSVLRFALGGLQDYEKREENRKNLQLTDRYILHILCSLHDQVEEYSKSYDFHKVGKLVINILTNQISGLYYTAVKDRLYCESIDSPSRGAAQYTLLCIFETISQIIAPILPHLVEEMYMDLPQKESKTFFTGFHDRLDRNWLNEDLDVLMQEILNCRKDMSKLIEGRTNEMEITIKCSENFMGKLKANGAMTDWEDELVHIFQAAKVTLIEDRNSEKYKIEAVKSSKFVCPRCRRVQSESENLLCQRCHEVVNVINQNKSVYSN